MRNYTVWVGEVIKMDNRKGVKISLLICLSIILILTVLAVILSIVALIAINHTVDHTIDQHTKDVTRVALIIIIVAGGIDIVIQILGIVAISRDHYCGSLAFTIYQGISLLFVVYNIIAAFAVTVIFSLLLKITIFALCVVYVRQLRHCHTDHHY